MYYLLINHDLFNILGARYEEDITIIGAGIGGTYTGWRLRNKGLRVGIYEYSDRVGGRMYTRRFPDAPDLPIEFGAMRLLPEEHLRMMKAGNELGLHFVPFNEGLGKIPNRTILFYRDTHMTTFELGGTHTPYSLRPEELRNPVDLEQFVEFVFLLSTLSNDELKIVSIHFFVCKSRAYYFMFIHNTYTCKAFSNCLHLDRVSKYTTIPDP